MRIPTRPRYRLPAAAGALAIGFTLIAGVQHAAAAKADATTSVDADQAALVFDAAFTSHAKTGRSAAAATSAHVDKPWSNTVDRNFYGQ